MLESNLRNRFATAFLLLPIAVACIYLGGILSLLLALLVFAAINWEYFSFATPFARQTILQCCLLNALLPLGFLWGGFPGFALAVVFGAMLMLLLTAVLVESAQHAFDLTRLVPSLALGFLYPGIVGSGLIISSQILPGKLALWGLLVVVINDSAAYFGGRAIGGPKFIPRISPNKTRSGLVIGLIVASLGGVGVGCLLAAPYHEEVSHWAITFFAALFIGVFAVVGDLVESLVKRAYGVKDSGTTLPGHGGVLDRVDALLFALPALYLVMGILPIR